MEPIFLRLEPIRSVLLSAEVLHIDSFSGRYWLGPPTGNHRVRTMLVAGSNGKGSTVTFAETILRSAGIKTGAYLSPWREEPGDSTTIGGRAVGTDTLRSAADTLAKITDGFDQLTEFERWTAATLFLFAHHPVEWAIIEVGLGGRLDATNVLDPDISIITNISLDHTEFLGDSLPKIAWEKGGITRAWAPLVTAMDASLIPAALQNRPTPAGIYSLGHFMTSGTTNDGFWYHDETLDLSALSLGLSGNFQTENAALAICACRLAKPDLSPKTIALGLRAAQLPVRWDVRFQRPMLVLDGAHNEGGVRAIGAELAKSGLPRPWVWVWACRKNRQPTVISDVILPFMDRVITTTVPQHHTWAADDLLPFATAGHLHDTSLAIPDPKEALDFARVVAGSGGTVFIIGSLYLVGALSRYADPAQPIQDPHEVKTP